MKNYLLILLVFGIAMVSCSKDDEDDDCMRADFIGEYTGTSNCVGHAAFSTFTLNITEGANENEIEVTDPLTTRTFTVDGCKAEYKNGDFKVTLKLDGNEIKGEEVTELPLVPDVKCGYTVTK